MIKIYHRNYTGKKAQEKRESLHKNSIQDRNQKKNSDWGSVHGEILFQ